MPDFNSWVKAQLKRGVSPSEIKKALQSRGYPESAVAIVDKFCSSGSFRTSSNVQASKCYGFKILRPLPLIILIILFLVISYLAFILLPNISKDKTQSIPDTISSKAPKILTNPIEVIDYADFASHTFIITGELVNFTDTTILLRINEKLIILNTTKPPIKYSRTQPFGAESVPISEDDIVLGEKVTVKYGITNNKKTFIEHVLLPVNSTLK